MEKNYKSLKTFPVRSYVLPFSESFFKIDILALQKETKLLFRLLWGSGGEATELVFVPSEFHSILKTLREVLGGVTDAQEMPVFEVFGEEVVIEVSLTGDGLKFDLPSQVDEGFILRGQGEALAFQELFEASFRSFFRLCNWMEISDYVAQPVYGQVAVHNQKDKFVLLSASQVLKIYEAYLELDKKLIEGASSLEAPPLALEEDRVSIDLIEFEIESSWVEAEIFFHWLFYRVVVSEDPNFQYWKKITRPPRIGGA